MRYLTHLLLLPLFLPLLFWVNTVEADGTERAKAPILSVEPWPTPSVGIEKGRYDAGASQPIPLKGENDGRCTIQGSNCRDVSGASSHRALQGVDVSPLAHSVLGEIIEACFMMPSTGLFCVPGSTVLWGAQSLALIDNCENKDWNPNAVSETDDWGLWQPNRIHERRLNRLGYGWEQVTDPTVNGILALSIWSDNQSFGPWSCGHWAAGAVVARGE